MNLAKIQEPPLCKPIPKGFISVRRRKTHRKGLSEHEIYLRKETSRQRRAEEVRNNTNILQYLDWIRAIKVKLKLSNAAFAARLGISCQSVKLWFRKSGHLPSDRVFKRLLVLEREANIPVIDLKLKFGIRYGK